MSQHQAQKCRLPLVLILVVMEDTQWVARWLGMVGNALVLILVVMEDTQWAVTQVVISKNAVVLILVVMEDTQWVGSYIGTYEGRKS